MPVFKPRNRLVNFRLSEEEFDKLQGGCRVHGARSLSDFARSCVLRDLSFDKPEPASQPAGFAFQQINSKVDALETRVEDLLRLVDSLRQSSESSHSVELTGVQSGRA